MAYYIREKIPTLEKPDWALGRFETLIPFWGELTLEDVKRSTVLKYIEKRKRDYKKGTLSNTTLRADLSMLNAAISFAHKENIITVCPFVWKPKPNKPRERWLSKKEAAKLLRAARSQERAKHYIPLFIMIGLYTGARSEVIYKLRWNDIDFENGFIDFSRYQKSSNKRASRLLMPRRLKRELSKARQHSNSIGHVINDNGSPIKNAKKGFAKACEIAGFDDVTPHTLRHTAVSWMIQKGVSTGKVAMYVGMSERMVREVYGHLAPEHLKEAVESYG